ncbi:MAG: hypothetical protein U0232_28550 [Thermomicrobiales bacterium]
MAEIEYLGGVPGRERVGSVAVTVQSDTLRLKHGYLLGGWSYQVPLTAVTSVESATAREVLATNLLPPSEAARLDQPHERLLLIATAPGDHTANIVLRGPWTTLSDLRQAILQGRMRAAKQWHP